MRKLILFLLFGIVYLALNQAQVEFSVGSPPATINFNSYDGSGLSPTPSAGQLNSNEWIVVGLSDGDMTFGDTRSSGDFARGKHGGGTGTGGIFAFEVEVDNFVLGCQPTADDMTPGSFILRLINTGADPITEVSVSYKIWVRNDQNRSSSMNFSFSSDNITYTDIASANYTSTEASDGLGWVSINRTVNPTGLNIAQNEYLYLRWETDDVSGSGSRDEIGIDDIQFTSVLPVELTKFEAEYVNNSVQLNWETATETNNAGFQVQRQNSEPGTQNSEPVPSEDEGWEVLDFIVGHGTTNSPKYYSYVDEDLPNADKLYYRLKQIDNDGTYAYSKTVEIDLSDVTSVDEENMQYEFALEQNYPNPFNPVTTINFTIPNVVDANFASTTNAVLKVYNLLGQEVRTLFNEVKPAGSYQVQFDASDLPSGIYFYTLTYGNNIQTRKLALLK